MALEKFAVELVANFEEFEKNIQKAARALEQVAVTARKTSLQVDRVVEALLDTAEVNQATKRIDALSTSLVTLGTTADATKPKMKGVSESVGEVGEQKKTIGFFEKLGSAFSTIAKISDKVSKGIEKVTSIIEFLSGLDKKILKSIKDVRNFNKTLLIIISTIEKFLKKLRFKIGVGIFLSKFGFFKQFKGVLPIIKKVTDTILEMLTKLRIGIGMVEEPLEKAEEAIESLNEEVEKSDGLFKRILKSMAALAFNLLKTGGIVFGVTLLALRFAGFNITLKTLLITLKAVFNIFAAVAPAGLGRFANRLQIVTSSAASLTKAFGKLEVVVAKAFHPRVLGRLIHFSRVIGGRRGVGATLLFIRAMTKVAGVAQKAGVATATAGKKAAQSTFAFRTAGEAADGFGRKVGAAAEKFAAAGEAEAALAGGLGKVALKAGFAGGILAALGKILGNLDEVSAKVLGTVTLGATGLLITVISLTHIIGQLATAIGTKLINSLRNAVHAYKEAIRETFRFKAAVVGLTATLGAAAPTLKQWTEFVNNIASASAFARTEIFGALGSFLELGRTMNLTVPQMKELFTVLIDISAAVGVDLQQAARSLISALVGSAASARLLSVNLSRAKLESNELFKTFNKTFNQLNAVEKQQLRVSEVLLQGAAFTGQAALMTQNYAGATEQLSNNLEILAIQQGETMGRVFFPFVRLLDNFIQRFSAASTAIGEMSTILTGIIGVLFIALGFFARWSAIILGVFLGFKALNFLMLQWKGIDLASGLRKVTLGMAGMKEGGQSLTKVLRGLVLAVFKDISRAMGSMLARFGLVLGFISKAPGLLIKAVIGFVLFRKVVDSTGRVVSRGHGALKSLGKSFVGLGVIFLKVLPIIGKISLGFFRFLTLGGLIVAAIFGVGAAIKEIISVFTGAEEAIKVTGEAVTKTTRKFGLLKTVGRAVSVVFTKMNQVFAVVTSTVKTLVVGSIAIAVIAFQSLLTLISSFLPTGTGGKVIAFFTAVGTSIKTFFIDIRDLVLNLGDFFFDLSVRMRRFALDAKNSAVPGAALLAKTAEAAADTMQKLAVVMGKDVKVAIDSVSKAGTKLANATFWTKIKQNAAAMGQGFIDAKTDFIKGMKEWNAAYKQAGADFVQIAKDTANAMSSSFSNLFFDTMMGKTADLKAFMTSMFQSIARSISDALGRKLTSELIDITGPITSRLKNLGAKLGLGGKAAAKAAEETKKQIDPLILSQQSLTLETSILKESIVWLGGRIVELGNKIDATLRPFVGGGKIKKGLEKELGGRTTLGREGGFPTKEETREKFLKSLEKEGGPDIFSPLKEETSSAGQLFRDKVVSAAETIENVFTIAGDKFLDIFTSTAEAGEMTAKQKLELVKKGFEAGGTPRIKEKITEAAVFFEERIKAAAQVFSTVIENFKIGLGLRGVEEQPRKIEEDEKAIESTKRRTEAEEEQTEAQKRQTSSLRESTSATSGFTSSLSGILGKIGGFFGGTGGLANVVTRAATGGRGGGGFLGTALGFASKFLGFQHGGVANLDRIGSTAMIAKSPTIATISEKEPEIISPLSKLEDLIKPTVINIQAIDARSAAQWFRDNKEIVMGSLFSNRSTTTKNLSPISRGPF